MTVNSTGEQNRVAGRDYNESKILIDQFDGRHTINIGLPSDNENKRPLVKAQRKELNSLVAAIVESSDTEAFSVWHKVHAEIGVGSIDEITTNQYPIALSYLQAMLEGCKEKDANKTLVSILLRNSESNEVRQKLIRYCHINFGTGRLNDLTRAQLQLALSWLERQGNTKAGAASLTHRYGMMQLLQIYPKEIGLVFIVGFLLGALIL